MSAPPRPRPRPKMRTATPVASSADSAAVGSTAASTSNSPPASTDVYDMFNLNRAEERKLRAQRAEEEARQKSNLKTIELSDDDDTVDILSSPDGKRKRGKTSNMRIRGTAEWTLKNPHAPPAHGRRGSSTAIETDSESDTNRGSSDSEVRILDETHGKGKKRAKSRSPTPPPPLSQTHRKAILTVVQEHLQSSANTSSVNPTRLDIPSKPLGSSGRKDKMAVEPGSAEGVTITVRWEPHPYDEVAMSLPTESFEFYQHREQTLRQVFLQLTEKKHLFIQDLVVMKDGQPITQAITPLKLSGYSGHLNLTACEENAYQVMLVERQAEAAAKAVAATEPALAESSTGASGEAKEDEDEVKRLGVTIRSATHPQPVTFRVKATITCGALLKRYLKDRAITAKGNTRLQFDGEDLDGDVTLTQALEDADFDDDEEEVQLDVAGL